MKEGALFRSRPRWPAAPNSNCLRLVVMRAPIPWVSHSNFKASINMCDNYWCGAALRSHDVDIGGNGMSAHGHFRRFGLFPGFRRFYFFLRCHHVLYHDFLLFFCFLWRLMKWGVYLFASSWSTAKVFYTGVVCVEWDGLERTKEKRCDDERKR